MTVVMFSPTLSASSHTSASRNVEMESVPELDVPMDFSELLNLDEFESSYSHSPTTISPNHTPSPLPAGQSPYAMSPTFDFLQPNHDFSLDFLTEKSIAEPGPSTMTNDLIQIKQEPVEFGWPEQHSLSQSPAELRSQAEASTALPKVPEMSLAGLPEDQQAALQQLMTNILNYQQRFGLDVGPDGTSATQPTQTIEPSMVFSNTTTNSRASSSFLTPSSISVQHPSPSVPAAGSQAMQVEQADEELLKSIEPHEMPINRDRAASTFSLGDNLDSRIDGLIPLPAIFSAGKGKGGKKGGGMSSVVRGEDEDIDDDDSWRPSPEEYKKLSSKEKRQLRNKLSARAFRTRRKDYIGTLEAHIKDRDTVIDAIRAELVSSRSENQDLRRELAALKASTMSVLHPETAEKSSQSPALFTALAALPSAAPSAATGSSNAAPRKTATPSINTRKDLPSSPALFDGSRGFWGGSDNFLGGGSTICHTMFTPDLVLPSNNPQPLRSIADLPRTNINPLLNATDPRGVSLSTASGRDTSGTFSEWSENNAFSLRSMDTYRMQMWSRLAREAQAEKSGLSGELRPKFFVEPKSPSSSFTSTSTAEASSSAIAAASAAHLASVAATHITSKLASSFWSAFASPSSKLDTDKLTAVVTGKARLQVVEDEKAPISFEDDLAAALGGLRLQAGVGRSTVVGARENPLGAISSFFKHAGAMPARA